jgi:hypothetical protein
MWFEVSQSKLLERPHLLNNQGKMDWKCASFSRASALGARALQAQICKFKPSHNNKERMNRRPEKSCGWW